jgi:hypothetical protein
LRSSLRRILACVFLAALAVVGGAPLSAADPNVAYNDLGYRRCIDVKDSGTSYIVQSWECLPVQANQLWKVA